MESRRLSLLLREVNDRIYELLESVEPDLPGEFLCECGRDCRRRVVLVPAAFAGRRSEGRAVRAPECSSRRRGRDGRTGSPSAEGVLSHG